MKKPNITPGEWVIDSDGDGKPDSIITSTWQIHGPDDDVCEVYGGNGDADETRSANARFIAAAPKMAEALESVLAWMTRTQNLNEAQTLKIRSALLAAGYTEEASA